MLNKALSPHVLNPLALLRLLVIDPAPPSGVFLIWTFASTLLHPFLKDLLLLLSYSIQRDSVELFIFPRQHVIRWKFNSICVFFLKQSQGSSVSLENALYPEGDGMLDLLSHFAYCFWIFLQCHNGVLVERRLYCFKFSQETVRSAYFPQIYSIAESFVSFQSFSLCMWFLK